MTNEEPSHSWQRTRGYLLDARSHLSEPAEAVCGDEIAQFDEFLEHNELELALGALENAYAKSQWESYRVLELLALAAASMGLEHRQRALDEAITNSRGWTYTTILPQSGA